MSSYSRRQRMDDQSYWEHAEAEAHALATLFPDWPGREDDSPDWLHAHTQPPVEPPPMPVIASMPPIPMAPEPEPAEPPRERLVVTPVRQPLKAPPREYSYAPKPQITTLSPYLRPLTNQPDNSAVWTHINVQELPFTVQSLVTLSAIPSHWSPRGFCHRHAWVAIQLLQGGFSMVLDDGEKTSTLSLYSTDQLLLLPPLVWRRFVNVLDDTLLLCISSHPVAESMPQDGNEVMDSEWITQYAEFLALRHSEGRT